MASIIRIKRSSVSGNPATLAAGELAYSALTDNSSNGGDRLYIGMGTETNGNAANHIVIGGKYFTDMLDHASGVLTANSALIVDSNSKLDNLKVDNLDLNGNTISTTDTNGDLYLSPNGTGKTVVTNLYIGDTSTSLTEYIQDITGGQIVAGLGIDVAYDDAAGTTTVSAELASSSNAGVASFNSTDFTATGTGENEVTLNVERIEDIVGGMVSGVGATQNGISVGYDDTNGKLTFDVADPTITIDGDVDGSATMTNLGNTTITVTLDTVNSNTGQFGSSSDVPVITVNGKGLVTAVSTAPISTSFTLAADTGTADTFNNGETLTIAGGEGIDTAVTNNTITISGEDASTSNKGIASFNSASFDVASGVVSIKTGGVSNSQLANSSLTVGSTTISLGGTSTSISGLTEIAIDNININGNEISSTDTNGNISLNPNGTGTVDVNGARITGLGTPSSSTDAVTKLYVDEIAQGLSVKPAVKAATTTDLGATYDNGTSGVGSTLTIPATATLDIDGVTQWSLFDGILIKNQTNAFENGRYYVSTIGNISTAWVLTRCAKCDQPSEIPSMYVFVQEGTLYSSTGWVATVENFSGFQVGVDDITFTQFSGAGTYLAGDALSITGSTFNVNVAATGGIEISADALQLKSTVAGDGLSLSAGVLAVGGTTDRITVSSDAVDIASTYAGQTSIITLGTVTTGTWSATAIGTTKGGTGLTSYATGDLLYASGTNTLAALAAGATGKILQINASGVPVWGDVDGGTY